jgi:hypothetical protein
VHRTNPHPCPLPARERGTRLRGTACRCTWGAAVSAAIGLVGVAIAGPTLAQQSGWHYSPYAGEGDRAALGCAYESTPEIHTCVAVRCEDDFSVALYVDTKRLGGDGGRWRLQIDEATHEVVATPVANSPYGAKVEGDVAAIIDAIKNGVSLYLDPLEGSPLTRNGIGLSGSLYAINQALYFCAPKAPSDTVE